MLNQELQNVRKTAPLVHCITNYVTANDCANILLACGGSPTMSDYTPVVEDVTTLANALVINIGTLNDTTIESMILAGKKANELGKKVLLDPVGVGAAKFITDTAKKLLNEIHFDVIRGNISEIKTLAVGQANTRGVDASELDAVNDDNMDEVIAFSKKFAKEMDCVVAISGATDVIADANNAYIITNGCAMMAQITGSGCMLSALTGAYIGSNDDTLKATLAAFCSMGIAGEKAYEKMKKEDVGNSTYRNYLIDEIYKMQDLEGAKYEAK